MRLSTILLLLFAAPTIAHSQALTPEVLWKIGRVSEPRVSPDGKLVLYSVRSFVLQDNKGSSDIYIIPSAGGNTQAIAASQDDESHARWRPDGKIIGFIKSDANGSRQLWEMRPDGSELRQVTRIKGGISTFGYAQDLKHIWYAADVVLDKKPSEIYPDLPKTEGARIIDGLMYRHWNTWHDYAYSHLFVASYSDGTSGEGKDIMPGERFDAPTAPFGGDEQVSFSPDGNQLAYTCKKLQGTPAAISTNTDIYIYQLSNGNTLNITDGMEGYDIDPRWSPDGASIAWLSMEKPGYESDRNRLFLYNTKTKSREEQLFSTAKDGSQTAFPHPVNNAAWTSDSKSIVFTASVEGTKQVYVFATGSKSGPRKLTSDQADYNELSVSGSSSSPAIVTSRTDMSMPSELFRIDAKSGQSQQLTRMTDPVWAGIEKSKVVKRMVNTSDGKQELVWVIYPPGFDPSKKYPALLFCQGGPQSVVSQSFSYRWNFSLIASQGYIVVAPNRRGLPSFGEEWNDAIAGDWGGQAMQDLLSAIDDVSKEPYVDRNRLGAVGASFGGFSVYWLAGHHQKRFKAFISHCGVFNLESEFGATEEMFFAQHDMGGNYWDKPEPRSFSEFSPHRFVRNWDTPMLVIHNEKDFRVPLNQGMEAFTAAQIRGVPSRFLYFPDEGHHVLKPQNSVLWYRVFFEWLNTYLK